MKILVLGGAGMVGQKLAQSIANGGLGDISIDELILHDIVEARSIKSDFKTRSLVGDIANNGEAIKLAELKADMIFHLAAIVSGEAETNFEKGWNTNARGSWQFLEALKQVHEATEGQYRPRLVFTSSIAVFGGPYPDKIGDEFLSAPQSSYGAQKAITELLVSDYSRKGFIDGISIRLPTVVVRPGKANLAASSFFSGIIREPLNGKEALLPVGTDVRHWHVSPRTAIGFLTHAANLDTSLLQGRLAINMPGISCTVAEQIEALRNIAGEDAVRLIKREPDDLVMRLVSGWPRDFDPQRALAMGFAADKSFEDIIRIYIEDDLDRSGQ
ncbi:SDR family oxidoreductase [Hoeflea sp. WL0058]|uniref:SDR family oxidoreductase n=1 Tax=Flavimaribacter sediminis TaxID=2865987 RepID=A0AAE3CZU3_9HYPH|nr:D-erythronate dehydrogenase [Flavimaribacter sediminis]MBW8637029.1 SDR family oxidoreductase [Flavimaribacter sediminis]